MKELEPYQQRVIDEKKDLDGKIKRLDAFVNSEKFPTLAKEERERMDRQFFIMQQYSEVLGERIAAF